MIVVVAGAQKRQIRMHGATLDLAVIDSSPPLLQLRVNPCAAQPKGAGSVSGIHVWTPYEVHVMKASCSTSRLFYNEAVPSYD